MYDNYKSILELEEFQNKFNFHSNNTIKNKEYQIVFSGGGITGYYGVGIGHVINNYMSVENIKGFIGTSSGALCCVYIACNISMKDWYETISIVTKEVKNGKTLLQAMNIANNIVLPENAHELCNKKNVEIVATKISLFGGIKKKIFSNFSTREELLQCLSASCCLPYLINWKYPYSIKINNEYYIDGGISNNVPIKNDCLYEQIVIKSYNLSYPILYRFSPIDKNIHKLMIKGAEDFSEFLYNPSSNNNKVIQFCNKKINKKRRLIINFFGSTFIFYSIIYTKKLIHYLTTI
jgi:predicted patatin/cPLA2 family phospholipase